MALYNFRERHSIIWSYILCNKCFLFFILKKVKRYILDCFSTNDPINYPYSCLAKLNLQKLYSNEDLTIFFYFAPDPRCEKCDWWLIDFGVHPCIIEATKTKCFPSSQKSVLTLYFSPRPFHIYIFIYIWNGYI